VPTDGNIAHVRVPGGHSVIWDDFDATADAIVDFLGSERALRDHDITS